MNVSRYRVKKEATTYHIEMHSKASTNYRNHRVSEHTRVHVSGLNTVRETIRKGTSGMSNTSSN